MPRTGLDRAAVIAEAGLLADEAGLAALSLAALARRLGVRSPSLYSHVDGLEDVHGALRRRGLELLSDRVGRAAIGKAGGDALEAVCHEFRAFAAQHPGLYAATVPARTVRDDEASNAAAGRLLETVLAVLAGYEVSGSDAVHAARFVRSALHGFITLEAGGGFGLPEDVDESFDHLVQAVTGSLQQDCSRA